MFKLVSKIDYLSLRLLASLLTLGLIASYDYLPQRKIDLLNSDDYIYGLFAEYQESGLSSVTWIDESQKAMSCEHKPHHHISCGLTVEIDPHYTSKTDLSLFEKIILDVELKGDAQGFRIFLRNFESDISVAGDHTSTKFMSTTIRKKELESGIVEINMRDFGTAEWWSLAWNVDRRASTPKFDDIQTLGLDFNEAGNHQLKVSSIYATGPWIGKQQLYFYLLSSWLVGIFIEFIIKYYKLHRRASALNKATNRLAKKAVTDQLTKAMNREGMLEYIQQISQQYPTIGVLILDIDFFKKINDTHGHDVGDRVLQVFSSSIQTIIRSRDAFARWGGEEFIIVTQETSEKGLMILGEKVREHCSRLHVPGQPNLKVTVSVGLSVGDVSEFDSVLKKADEALYRAKRSGRDRVCH